MMHNLTGGGTSDEKAMGAGHSIGRASILYDYLFSA
ncbi:hypothetical protein BBR47_44080 [Brevibacillus brevis NBRC 100599]|uniref:Uncharacterized protein n=1 Tax=Brevibacillus brevis (strain 47 / JCM 6285 / NBRC 100599) TaxID=358681 RepID=C0ZJ10_BREBN|nr:hypothetical protein BBR47_44080 [Brevibacillus brevis NBRC 100599]